MKQVARGLTEAYDRFLAGSRYLIHDRDPLFTEDFWAILKAGLLPEGGVTPFEHWHTTAGHDNDHHPVGRSRLSEETCVIVIGQSSSSDPLAPQLPANMGTSVMARKLRHSVG